MKAPSPSLSILRLFCSLEDKPVVCHGGQPHALPPSGHMVRAFWAWWSSRPARHQSWPGFVPSAPCPAQRECRSPSLQSQPLLPLSPETLISLPHQPFLCGRPGSSRHTGGECSQTARGPGALGTPWAFSAARPLAPCRADAEVSLPEGTQYSRFPNVHDRLNDSATRGLPPPPQHASLLHPGVPRAQPWALPLSDAFSPHPLSHAMTRPSSPAQALL